MKKFLTGVFIIGCLSLLPIGCQNKSNTDQTSSSSTMAAEDQRITSAVREKLNQDGTLNDAKIEVETSDAVVNLNGTVTSDAQETEAVKVAQSIEGVRTVRSHLKTDASAGISGAGSTGTVENAGEKVKEVAGDAGITAKVKMKFAEDDQVSAMKIDVDTKDGVVILKGNVKSRSEEERAEQLARSVDGVRSVQSQLTVEASS